MNFRAAAFAAVSSDEQVDKASLGKQVEACRDTATHYGGVVAGVYIADGYSRTGYWSLTDARQNIPPLDQCLSEMNKWDVLLVKNFDRLGSLGEMIYNYLASHKKQLRSVEQFTPIFPPELFDPYKDSSTAMLIKVGGVTQVYRINKLHDNLVVGIEKRIKDGKFAQAIPRGYIDKSDRHNYRVEIDPILAPLIVKVKNLYMSGESLETCAKWATDNGMPMHERSVHYMLLNPFYAGMIGHNRYPRVGRGPTRKPNPNVELHKGVHDPLWTYDEYLRITAEVSRRGKSRKHKRTRTLSGMLSCHECGKHLQASEYSEAGNTYGYYRCRAGHVSIKIDDAMEQVASQLQQAFADYPDPPPVESSPVIDNKKTIDALNRQRAKIQQAYETTDTYTLEEFRAKIAAIDAEKARLQDTEKQAEQAKQEAEQWRADVVTMREALPYMRDFLTRTPPHKMNNILSKTIRRITVYPDKRLQIELRNGASG